jgi:hypothetical protein
MAQAVFGVGLVVLGALFAFAVQVERLRARVLRHERGRAELARTVATVQGWAAQELRALRDEFTVERVAAEAGLEDDPEDRRDTVAMPAPTAKPGNDDGDETTFLERAPPMYATRSPLIRPPAPLDQADLSGSDDVPSHLDPEEKTPPRRGRSALLLPAFQAPVEESA